MCIYEPKTNCLRFTVYSQKTVRNIEAETNRTHGPECLNLLANRKIIKTVGFQIKFHSYICRFSSDSGIFSNYYRCSYRLWG